MTTENEAAIAERIATALSEVTQGAFWNKKPFDPKAVKAAAEAISHAYKGDKLPQAVEVLLQRPGHLRDILKAANTEGATAESIQEVASRHYGSALTQARKLMGPAAAEGEAGVKKVVEENGPKVEEIEQKAEGAFKKFFRETNESKLLGRKGLVYIGVPAVVLGGAWAMMHGRSADDPKADVESQIKSQGAAAGLA